MSKNKKSKVVQLRSNQLSPEKYIKTQARSLPIAECLVSEDWQNAGICNIIVARRHKTGNITAGVYLVDLYCLGLKNTSYHFNLDQDGFEFLKENCGDQEECEYVLAHNIIYGAIEFADEYGFQPHKDFAITQFILEQDDENVELTDIEFGFDGMPFYVQGPNDNAAKINHIKSTLLRTAGTGNFKVLEGFDDEEFEGDLPQDDGDGDGYDFVNTLKSVNRLYDQYIQTKEAKELFDESTIGKAYQLVEEPVENVYRIFDSVEQEEHYDQLLDMVSDDQPESAVKGIKEAIVKYTGKAPFYNLLQSTYLLNNQNDKSDELVVEMYERFPGYLFAIVNYINLLLEDERENEVQLALDGNADLNDWYPDRKQFSRHEAAIFYATMCRYFIIMGDIGSADLYMYPILKNKLFDVPGQSIVKTVMLEIAEAKMEKIKSKEF